ncbi:MAG TPA: biotin-dependent carboxyltransferase family protein [Bacillales bacterium]
MSIKIIKPGLLTSVQDLGRHGYQKYGVIASGVMDPLACRITNLLVGNDEGAAVLETTLLGPKIEFQEDALIALGGGDMSPSINGEAVQSYRSVWVKKGSVLQFGPSQSGCRVYLAVAGGVDVPRVMDSYSTYLRAEIGGFQGRALKKEDVLPTGSLSDFSVKLMKYLQEQSNGETFREMGWGISSELLPEIKKNPTIRTLRGRQFEWFTNESREKLFSEAFEVTTQSDRMGYRLKGPKLSLTEPKELLSEAVTFGTIQVPSEGNPIVLLADRQTTGGYPKIGQVASVDLPVMAQVKPGEKVSFKEIGHEEAQRLYLENERNMQRLKLGLDLKSR